MLSARPRECYHEFMAQGVRAGRVDHGVAGLFLQSGSHPMPTPCGILRLVMLTEVENVETRERKARCSLERTAIGREMLVADKSLTICASGSPGDP
jgi:hypothetical protein